MRSRPRARMRRAALMACAGRARSVSLDLHAQWQTMEQQGGKWRFTSPTHTVLAFAQALRELLDTTLRNARGGMDLDRALAQAAAPWRVEALDVLSVVLGVCVRIGGRSDQVLQRLSDFMRDLDQAQQELKATTSETRMSAWVLALLPPISALMMALASPGFFEPMLREPQGHKILLAALGLELVGGFLLHRLAKSI